MGLFVPLFSFCASVSPETGRSPIGAPGRDGQSCEGNPWGAQTKGRGAGIIKQKPAGAIHLQK